jgi:hypothetical protein
MFLLSCMIKSHLVLNTIDRVQAYSWVSKVEQVFSSRTYSMGMWGCENKDLECQI